MSRIFNCPACGKPMEYDGETTLFQTCGSCNAPIVVPVEVVEANRDQSVVLSDQIKVQTETSELSPINDPKVIMDARIFEAVNSGNKTEAVNLHQKAFLTDAATAKNAVDELEREIARSKNLDYDSIEMTVDERYTDFVRLLTGGRKVEAIKLFRERFGTSLSDAKNAVEAIERGETP